MKTWFNRSTDGEVDVQSLEETLTMLVDIWDSSCIPFDGCLGFSQGGTLATLIACMPNRFRNLKFCICVGAPNFKGFGGIPDTVPSHVRSLHFAGKTDAVVSIEMSRALAARYAESNAKFITHEQGHCIPMKAEVMNEIKCFLQDISQKKKIATIDPLSVLSPLSKPPLTSIAHIDPPSFLCATESIALQQSEEIETLCAIYPDTINVLQYPGVSRHSPCASLEVSLCSSEDSTTIPQAWLGSLGLKILFTEKYPEEEVPEISLSLGKMTIDDFDDSKQMHLLSVVNLAAQDALGGPAIFSVIQAALDWLRDGDFTTNDQGKASQELKSEDKFQDTPLSDLAKNPVALQNPIVRSLINDQENKEEEDVLETVRVRQATAEAASLAGELKKMQNGEELRPQDSDGNAIVHKISEALRQYTKTASTTRGVWNYTVGLIGKPSAGKSTFYNACTQACLEREGRRLAAVAPHPFTTIEPNVGPGWFAGPSDTDHTSERGALHGRDKSGRRLLPVLVKDVAGLVPGAYKGRGKGNRFLNDLCDADVLVHVVDATGRSDKDGNVFITDDKSVNLTDGSFQKELSPPVVYSSPSEDAQWIREELHRWIYGNVKAKWPSVIRLLKTRVVEKASTAHRIFQLFSGYQAPKDCVEMAALRCQLSLDDAYSWSVLDLHRLVANYLLIRFPVCLALNKVDAFPAEHGTGSETIPVTIVQCQEDALARGEVAVPVSARAENWVLQKLCTAKSKESSSGDSSDRGSISTHGVEELALQRVLRLYGSTGVLNALSSALFLRSPVFCYPVSDLDSELPVGWTSGKGLLHTNESAPALLDCLLFKPGSTVGDVYAALRKGALPHVIMHGEFVRAEGRALDRRSKKKQVGKDTLIDETCCVLRIQTNRRSVWQHLHSSKKGASDI